MGKKDTIIIMENVFIPDCSTIYKSFINLNCKRNITINKVLYEEIMTNNDNLEPNLLTSILLKMLVQVLLQVESEICYCVDPDPK